MGGFAEDNSTSSEQSVLTGKVYIENIRKTEFDAFEAAWPELKVSYNYMVPQNTVSFYNGEEELKTIYVDRGSICPDPLENNLFEVPTKESTDQYNFVFAGWSIDNSTIIDLSTTLISSNTILYAMYNAQSI